MVAAPSPFRPPHILRLETVSFAALPGHDKERIVKNSELGRLEKYFETDEAGSLLKPERTVEPTGNATHKARWDYKRIRDDDKH